MEINLVINSVTLPNSRREESGFLYQNPMLKCQSISVAYYQQQMDSCLPDVVANETLVPCGGQGSLTKNTQIALFCWHSFCKLWLFHPFVRDHLSFMTTMRGGLFRKSHCMLVRGIVSVLYWYGWLRISNKRKISRDLVSNMVLIIMPRHYYIDDFMHDCSTCISIAITLEIHVLQSCTKPLIYVSKHHKLLLRILYGI